MADFGEDVSTFPDLDVTGNSITGLRTIAEACLRRLSTPEGSLEYDPDYGYDLRDLLNEDLDARDLRRHAARAEIELEKDERIARADVVLSLEPTTHKLTIRITGTLVNAIAFQFVLGIDAVTSDVLKAA